MTQERSISFNDQMIDAILSGNKTQTRRPMKPQLEMTSIDFEYAGTWKSWALPMPDGSNILYPNGKAEILSMCPYGAIGDRLRVPENPDILLEIVDIRVERLQDIAEADAKAEGIEDASGAVEFYSMIDKARQFSYPLDSPQALFAAFWDEIYPQSGMQFEDNPWVWVVEFKEIE
jgi:hypothetical protein